MHTDPYSGMLGLFRVDEDGEPICKLEIGVVRSAQPLIISAAGLENEQDDIVIVQHGNEAPALTAGNTVLLLTADYQKFYVIGRLI